MVNIGGPCHMLGTDFVLICSVTLTDLVDVLHMHGGQKQV